MIERCAWCDRDLPIGCTVWAPGRGSPLYCSMSCLDADELYDERSPQVVGPL